MTMKRHLINRFTMGTISLATLTFSAIAAGIPLPKQQTSLGVVTPMLIGRVSVDAINEQSGLIKSRQYKNTYWVHNDSGDSSRIFAVRRDGTIIKPMHSVTAGQIGTTDQRTNAYKGLIVEPAKNVDWEDITTDGKHLYISDMGNNGNARRHLGVYVVSEPNPQIDIHVIPLQFIQVRYPDQAAFPDKANLQFDCEAMFYYRKRLWFLTKHRISGKIGFPDSSTKLYALPAAYKPYEMNDLEKLDTLSNLGGWVTGASVSLDGQTLAVLTHFPRPSVWFFKLDGKSDRLLQGKSYQVLLSDVGQCEGITFDNNDAVIISSEGRGLYLLKKPVF